jgi:DNA topoisomerase-1
MYKKKNYKKKIVKNVPDRAISKEVKYLIIVESPSKCQKIEGFLGPQYHCIASKGHIRKISSLKSIDTENNFETDYDIIEEKKSHIESMKKIISQFPKENIILAMDDDREGEGIAWHICQVFDLDIISTKRILFREITQEALKNAVSNPTKLNMQLVYAQQARQILDIIVGYKISPILWKYLYSNKENSLSAGRCQTPALRLIYDRRMEESNKTIKLVYKTIGNFFSRNILFELSRDFESEKEIIEFLEKSKNFKYYLSISEKKKNEKSPPKPFNTSNLLQTASNILAMSPKETTALCQQLYQEGHITYIRTDSIKYSKTFISEAKNYISNKYNSEYLGELSLIENKDESNPHEAIRVTHIETDTIKTDNKRLASLYKLIWRNTIESCMAPYKYTLQKAITEAPMNLYYSKEIEVPIFLGWKKVLEKESETNEQNKGSALLFYLETIEKTKKSFSHTEIQSKVSVRNIEKHYTEASLIKKLEDLGIGRPSTFASIIDTIQERGYVKKEDIEGKIQKINEFYLRGLEIEVEKSEKKIGESKNKLVIQQIGILTIEFLVKYFNSLLNASSHYFGNKRILTTNIKLQNTS